MSDSDSYLYVNPSTFLEGNKYFLLERKDDGTKVYFDVIFVSYSSSPVFVYVKRSTDITKVLRDDMYERILA